LSAIPSSRPRSIRANQNASRDDTTPPWCKATAAFRPSGEALGIFGGRNQLRDIWESENASQAFERGEIQSKAGNGESLRLAFRNATPIPLLLCWISDSGTPHHFYTLKPLTSIDLLDEHVTLKDKIENTFVGHCFAVARCDDHEAARKSEKLDAATVIGGYRPSRLSFSSSNVSSERAVHIVTITQSDASSSRALCLPRPPCGTMLRGSKAKLLETDSDQDDVTCAFHISVCEGIVDKKPLDTSNKQYKKENLGGWPVFLEPGWDKGCPGLRKQLEKDLKAAAKCLPAHARVHLQKTTPIYINRSQKYGPEVCPVNARGCCFHPDKQWLIDNGMSTDKAECVEIYQSSEYLKDREYWGPGGLILHELSHAYHWKMCEEGYDNAEIMSCYEKAMKDGLYDCVSVHGRKEATKAYACENQMEYFAELSVAFLGGIDDETEHNKWFPFCRKQLREHDPRAYKLLQRIWKVYVDNIDED
jgi:hypothetical protein